MKYQTDRVPTGRFVIHHKHGMFICPLCWQVGNGSWRLGHSRKWHIKCQCGKWFVSFQTHLNKAKSGTHGKIEVPE